MAVDAARLRVVAADRVPPEDVLGLLAPGRCHGSGCWCQRFRVATADWAGLLESEKEMRLAAQVAAGEGAVGYLGEEAVGWAGVAPRAALAGLARRRIVWAGRSEDRDDPGVWAVHCLFVRAGHRRQGLTRPLVQGAVAVAKRQGARAIEAYPMIAPPGQEVSWGEMHVGSPATFAAAGFAEVSRPTKRRMVMRFFL